ncbi:dermatopontin-like isoform X2 [Haliotis rubra]|uniref:dermatopontin-like isoform X2 n=1 Tax=Haliotis rubra TaxID=36100 RepID=UPI001EE5A626|nr:dermatopontin-like isoform X2 [Haliotis rubra]
MLTIAFLLLSLVSVVTSSYVNDFNEPLLFKCPKGMSIASWESYHENSPEDRRHRFTCKTTRGLGKCQWSGYVNQFEQPVSFQCPNNGVISGVSSIHSNGPEDRRFDFYCCSLRCEQLVQCQGTGYVNNWDGYLNFLVPVGRFLKGVSSVHHNVHKDRRWAFETCLIR